MRPIDANTLKRNMTKLVNEIGPTIMDAEYLGLLLQCIDNEPMCSMDGMKDIINFYEKD